MTGRLGWLTALISLGLSACGTATGDDAGSGLDAGADAGSGQCARSTECGDDFCRPQRCAPGDPIADARGCVALDPPCATGETCDEASNRCVACSDGSDIDGDGHDAIACGGDDCDDTDPSRFPGNPEVCDASHDEDCDPLTLGDADADADGFVSAMCCNGERCGDDCDDSVRATSPGAREECNALDDDCDSRVDETGAFCPVGSCVDGRCRGLGWERVFGRADGSTGTSEAIAVDDAGTVYVVVGVLADEDLDDDSVAEAAGSYLIAYEPNGRVRWLVPVPAGAFRLAAGRDVFALVPLEGDTMQLRSPTDGSLVSEVPLARPSGWTGSLRTAGATWSDDSLFILATAAADGSAAPPEGMLLLRFDGAGTETARRLLHVDGERQTAHALATSAAGVAVVGSTTAPLDLGDGAVVEPDRAFVARLDDDFSTLWAIDQLPDRAGTEVALSDEGEVALVGRVIPPYAPFWGAPSRDSSDGFIVSLDASGSYGWHRFYAGARPSVVTYDERGLLLVSGSFFGTLELAPRGNLTSANPPDALFIAFDAVDGFIRDARQLAGGGFEAIVQAAADPFGSLLLFGFFSTDITLPLGHYSAGRPSLATPPVFVAKIADL